MQPRELDLFWPSLRRDAIVMPGTVGDAAHIRSCPQESANVYCETCKRYYN